MRKFITIIAIAMSLSVLSIDNADAKKRTSSPNCITYAELQTLENGMKRWRVENLTGLNIGANDHSISGFPKCSGGTDQYSSAWLYFPEGNDDRLFRHRWNWTESVGFWYCEWYPLSVGCTIDVEDVL